MLNVKDIKFSYGKTEVLKGISFDAEENQVISILGSNGAGKTTLLKCLCNMHRPNEGEAFVNGTNVLSLTGRELARNIGYVPQTTPTSRMTVYDSVLIGRKPHFELAAGRADLDKTSSVIDAMGLSHLSLRYLDEISGGEFQKVQIARAIVQEPKVLILDEPTNNLDITNQHNTMHMIEDAVRSRGMCTIMTMHDINLAIHYSDLFLFLSQGKMVAYGGVEVITEELIKEVYGLDTEIIYHHKTPLIVPKNSSRYQHTYDHEHPHDIHDHLVENINEAKEPEC